ncbi:class I SAM-dependent DNA methyltransferase [Brucella anthropi]|uniref:class I SAM-dependent DNA methyltransferase n=1 Tax=Brucella anthropi TaxID=529 RepID=UPI00124D5125|nr:DNA methyltransferase [Brucella anthropi]KAB2728007.1 class I SAM-dependent DNA methyltransferase [Brucella anthropi]KAB2745179.1 class I SAM-dependent DNA methyltransferase [Brucella anthropi]KAB2805604.1 class I SAM-dependent DNA methyltransferase [Brucella anthropi]
MQSKIETFIARWQGQEGGQERANYALFLTELCDLLGLPHADPAAASNEGNDYVFERVVKEVARDGSVASKRIDLYKKNCFVLEAKQSRLVGDKKIENTPQLPGLAVDQRGKRSSANRSWDVLMMNARAQAENYVRLLPTSHEPPPFVMVCDVGHCIEIYSNFRRDGKAYDQFPDRRSFRVYLEDLRDEEVRERLIAIWSDPLSLDPSRHAAKVTREIAVRIAKVSQALEKSGYSTEEVAMFLMRILFTMFAEDVELLPKDSFKDLLIDCAKSPDIFPGMMEDLWKAMDEGGFTATIRHKVKRFNGEFFKKRRALKLAKEEIGELAAAASYNWKDVEPAIFGTFLEQALDPTDRRKLGAHYTPRAYVERLVISTVIDPLRAEWDSARSTADRQKSEGKQDAAIKTVQAFHDKLCETRVLDPACGTGNFLYVSLELMKRLEGEVLEALNDLGGQEALAYESHTIDPHQFLGMEINPRAAAIAELVLWIGHLQWHFRNRGVAPSEPILKAFKNIQCMDAVLKWDGYPLPQVIDGRECYPNPRKPDWPKADYIVGNPPFVGGKDIRARMGSAYAEALWKAHKHMNESADFVMYWWDRAAEILLKPKSGLKRFGYVTTNSISQLFQRRVMEPYLNAKKPLSLLMAIPDHPWTKVTRDSAAVRIAITVAGAGKHDGRLLEVVKEEAVDTDSPVILFDERSGKINSDLTVGVDVASATKLLASEGLSSRGMSLHGAGFILSPQKAEYLGLGRHQGLDKHIRVYRNGRDLMDRPRGVMAVDLFGLTAEQVRSRYPEIYQHILTNVKPERDSNNRASYRNNWWVFGEPRKELRPALSGICRYIVTVETAKHRVFQFLEADILPDNMLVAIALSDSCLLGILSSKIHVIWALAQGGTLEDRPRYSKSLCFDPFPFPSASDVQKAQIGDIAEELDAQRKRVLEEHSHLTLTGLYNVLEMLKAGTKPDDLGAKERRIFDDGLVLILKELHEKLDEAVAVAYGWPADSSDEEILARLVSLNKERAKEEKRGLVRWLRPEYQIPRFGSDKEKAEQLEADLGEGGAPVKEGPKPSFPTDERDQTPAVLQRLMEADGTLDANAIALSFKQGRRALPAVSAVLAALYRMGLVSTSDGKSFSLRRVA